MVFPLSWPMNWHILFIEIICEEWEGGLLLQRWQLSLQALVQTLLSCSRRPQILTWHSILKLEKAWLTRKPWKFWRAFTVMVGGATEFFKAMTPNDKGGKNFLGHYFNSHPEALERIDNLYRLAKEMNFDVKTVNPLNDVLIKN